MASLFRTTATKMSTALTTQCDQNQYGLFPNTSPLPLSVPSFFSCGLNLSCNLWPLKRARVVDGCFRFLGPGGFTDAGNKYWVRLLYFVSASSYVGTRLDSFFSFLLLTRSWPKRPTPKLPPLKILQHHLIMPPQKSRHHPPPLLKILRPLLTTSAKKNPKPLPNSP